MDGFSNLTSSSLNSHGPTFSYFPSMTLVVIWCLFLEHSFPDISLIVSVLYGLSSALFSYLPSLFFPSSLPFFLSSLFLFSFLIHLMNFSYSSHFLCNFILTYVDGPWISISMQKKIYNCLLNFFSWITHRYLILSVLKTSQIRFSFLANK